MRKHLDLTGQRFGKLTVLRPKATICLNRRRCFLGYYPEFEDVVEARKRAEKARMRVGEDLHDSFSRTFGSVRPPNNSG